MTPRWRLRRARRGRPHARRAQGPGRLRRHAAPTAPCAWCAGGRAAGRWPSARGRRAQAARRGCGEVVLSGIDLGAWRDGRPASGATSWPPSAPSARASPGPARLRLSSLEPRAPRRAAARGARARARGAPPARAAAVGRRRRARGHGPPVHVRRVRGARGACARRRLGHAMLTTDVIVGFPARGRGRVRAHAGGPRARPCSGACTCSPSRRGRGRRRRSCRRCRRPSSRRARRARLAAAEAAAARRAPRRSRPPRGGPRRGPARRPLQGVQFGVHPLLPRRRGTGGPAGDGGRRG